MKALMIILMMTLSSCASLDVAAYKYASAYLQIDGVKWKDPNKQPRTINGKHTPASRKAARANKKLPWANP